MPILDSILVTGAAGFIGAALVKKLLINGHKVIGIDNMNSYYEVSLKKARLLSIENEASNSKGSFKFFEIDITDKFAIKNLFENNMISVVVHLAAQAGVRFSIENPEVYFQSNLVGFGNVLEVIRHNNVSNFIFASSSSVYGGSKQYPYNENQKVDNPVSLYAATKKSNELMAHAYSHLYKIPTTGLRFFTVYGPWGRPDMAPMIFAKAILEKRNLKIFNYGKMMRDFTFIDDITEGIYRCCLKPAYDEKENLNKINAVPYRIFNIGNGSPIGLMRFIEVLEKKLGMISKKEYLDMQKGDVIETWASTFSLQQWIGYKPQTNIEEGVEKFVNWYKNYYKM